MLKIIRVFRLVLVYIMTGCYLVCFRVFVVFEMFFPRLMAKTKLFWPKKSLTKRRESSSLRMGSQ